MRVPAEVIQVAIDDALKQANPFYEGLARPYIPQLEVKIQEALHAEGYSIVETQAWATLKDAASKVVSKA
jgi:hypothetical protein